MLKLQKVREFVLGVPIFAKVMGIAVGLTALLSAGMLWQVHETWHNMALREMEQRGQAIANTLALHSRQLLREGKHAELQLLLDHTRDASAETVYVALVDQTGAVLLHSGSRTVNDGVREFEAAVPMEPPVLVRVGKDWERKHARVEAVLRRLIGLTVLIAGVGMLATWGLTRVLTRPLREVVEVTRAVKMIDLSKRVTVYARDEVGELAVAVNEMIESLDQFRRQRWQYRRQAIAATEEERKRVARELHDHTGQALASLIAQLTSMEAAEANDARRQALAELRRQVEQTLDGVHELSRALRPSSLDDIGLLGTLEKHCKETSARFGVAVECEAIGLDGDRRLSAELEAAVYRIVQEGISNAVRHGQARSVSVLLQQQDSKLLVVIEDDGAGFEAHDWRKQCRRGERLGLLGIEERATLLGGGLRVESRPGSGTSLFVEIPVGGNRG